MLERAVDLRKGITDPSISKKSWPCRPGWWVLFQHVSFNRGWPKVSLNPPQKTKQIKLLLLVTNWPERRQTVTVHCLFLLVCKVAAVHGRYLTFYSHDIRDNRTWITNHLACWMWMEPSPLLDLLMQSDIIVGFILLEMVNVKMFSVIYEFNKRLIIC